MMDYLIRFAHVHKSFRRPEIEALAGLYNVGMKVLEYSSDSPFCIARFPNERAATKIVRRSILAQGLYELWGTGTTYEELHEDISTRSRTCWPLYATCSFRFTVFGFQVKRTTAEQREIIESFSYLGFNGPIVMNNADAEFFIFEDSDMEAAIPKRIYLARFISGSDRDAITRYDLKKRHYISTTSMDSELALITANMAHAAPGKIFYDPFVGTGSFPIACAHFGAFTMGSDIDGRTIRGKVGRNIASSFGQYDLAGRWMDGFISDLTNTPLRSQRILDGILCDPPYGVREGLKVLGRKDGLNPDPVLIDGKPAHLQEGFVPPKRPYGFETMLDDILHFAAVTLVDDGRLAMWMPTANDEDEELAIHAHVCLELVSVSVQPFNKWSRRLLTYRRLPGIDVPERIASGIEAGANGYDANSLNSFRRKYFEGFRTR